MPLMTAEERLGKTIDGKYRLDRILGEGGMGVVYEGQHVRLGRAVAVKFLHPQFSQHAEVVQRFVREAQSAARLQHPNVVDVRDIDTAEDGALYMVLELLAGESLAKRLSYSGQLSLADTLAAVLPCMDAVALAHEHGIVHRDIKPDNLHLSRSPSGAIVPKVLDFGIAKLAHSAGASSTSTGSVIGTPAYMAPEQAMGKKDVGPAADVWSMGVVLYECLAARLPFDFPEDAAPTAVVVTVVTTDPFPISRFRPDLPPQVAAVIDASLAKDATRRFATMRQFLDALRAAAAGLGVGVTGAHPPAGAQAPPGHVPHGVTGPVDAGTSGAGAWRAGMGVGGSQPGVASGTGPGISQSRVAAAHASQPGAAPTPSLHSGPTPFVSGGTVAQLESNLSSPRRPLALVGAAAVVGVLAVVVGAVALSGGAGPATPDVAAAAAPPTETSAAPPPVAGPAADPAPSAAAAPAAPAAVEAAPAPTAADGAPPAPTGVAAASHRGGHGGAGSPRGATPAAGSGAAAAGAPPSAGVVITAAESAPAPAATPPAHAEEEDGSPTSGTRTARSGSGAAATAPPAGSTTTGGGARTSGGTRRDGTAVAPRSGSMSADDF